MTPATWLVDKSALRPHEPAFADALIPRIAAGRVAVCLVTELEVGYSARSTKDFERTRDDVIGPLIPVGMPYRAEDRAREIQAELVARGQHRAVAIPDVLVAAIADVEGLTVLHYDGDFDIVAEVTGQPMEWILRPGTI
ncbi:MAG TPA: PIN domain nuclease [Euzebyales bacterium]|nr:PIN domain nuclease [Euzebyales bacterium]